MEVTYSKVAADFAQVKFNGQELPISIERSGDLYFVHYEDPEVKGQVYHLFNIPTREQAMLIVKGLVFDRLAVAMKDQATVEAQPVVDEEPKSKTKLEWRFNKGKYRAYLIGQTKQLMAFENLIHAHNWYNKHQHEYIFVKALPQVNRKVLVKA